MMAGKANPSAFDSLAVQYDVSFTYSALGQMLRQRIWRVLADYFHTGHNVLELACGTGEDAVWLAQRGVSVTATDGSAAMVKATTMKAQQASVAHLITSTQLSLQDLEQLPNAPHHYDGAFSNFGGLNVLGDRRPLAATLAQLVRPGGTLILVPMGPICPVEIIWYSLHGKGHTAIRRFRQPATASIGGNLIPIWYPSASRLRQEFAPWFKSIKVESLGLWLPPSSLSHWVERWPALFTALNWLDGKTARIMGGLGDHYMIVFQRKPSS
jgi:ubiquinone/menaquinone biosynthesis C-methylase UbiE